MQAFIRSEPRVYGHNEDGPVFEEMGFIVVEDDSGFRMAHDFSAPESDLATLERLQAKVQEAIDADGWEALSNDHWVVVDPCYGSLAHQRIGDYHLMDGDDIEAMRGH